MFVLRSLFRGRWEFLVDYGVCAGGENDGLEKRKKRVVTGELLGYLARLHRTKADTTGSPDPEGPVIPPYRVMTADDRDTWPAAPLHPVKSTCFFTTISHRYIIVDPETLNIKAIS